MAGRLLFTSVAASFFIMTSANKDTGTLAVPNLPTHVIQMHERQAPFTAPIADAVISSTLVPIATICPSGNASSVEYPIIDLGSSTSLATAVLPNGGSTVFAMNAKRQSNVVSSASSIISNANQLIVGADGCQTLFTSTTYKACSTVVRPNGMVPVTITDCAQYVTFSSEVLHICPPMATVTPLNASSPATGSMGKSFTSSTVFRNGSITNVTPTSTGTANNKANPTTTSLTKSITTAPGMPMPVARQMRQVLDERQIMANYHRKPVIKHAPMASVDDDSLQVRQLMFDRGGTALTDLTIVAPPQITTSQSTPYSTLSVRATTRASGTSGIDDLTPAIGIPLDPSGPSLPLVTRLMAIPAFLGTEFKRRYLTRDNHARHRNGDSRLEERDVALLSSQTISLLATSSLTLNLTNISPSNKTRLSGKASKMETIRLANTQHEAAVRALSPPSPTKFYAAPWSEIAAGGIPEHVLGITCYGGAEHIGECMSPDTDGDSEACECVTETQSWHVSVYNQTRTGTTTVSYVDPALISGTVAGAAFTTTSLSLVSAFTTTRVFQRSRIIKAVVTDWGTVTKTFTSMPSATVTLLAVGISPGLDVNVKAAGPQAAPISVSDITTSEGLSMTEDFPTTIVETSIVATETVTVLADDADLDALPDDGVLQPSNARRDDGWPSDVWRLKVAQVKAVRTASPDAKTV